MNQTYTITSRGLTVTVPWKAWAKCTCGGCPEPYAHVWPWASRWQVWGWQMGVADALRREAAWLAGPVEDRPWWLRDDPGDVLATRCQMRWCMEAARRVIREGQRGERGPPLGLPPQAPAGGTAP